MVKSLQGWTAVYYRELLILKRRLPRLIPSMSISPFLYLVAFGYAIGKTVTIQGHTYMEFLIPGLVAMSSMTQAFGIANEINIARFYWHIFEEFQAAPISSIAYVTGEVLAGITRSLLSIVVILIFGLLFGVVLSFNVLFWLAIVLNSVVFASLAVGLAMLVRSHADQALLTKFVLTPMAFLGGTFFPVEHLPVWAQHLLSLLPLTHASKAIRNASFGNSAEPFSYILLGVLGGLFFFIAYHSVNIARD